jgi:DNA-binding NarL/FixJ family response regulator
MKGCEIIDVAKRAASPIPALGLGALAASIRRGSQPRREPNPRAAPGTGWEQEPYRAGARDEAREKIMWRTLTVREMEIAQLVATGKRNKEVAYDLHLSRHTVESHLKRIYDKLQIQSRTELANLVRDIAAP